MFHVLAYNVLIKFNFRLSFLRYHMYGLTINTLKVFAKPTTYSSGQLGSVIWTMSGGRENKWYRATVELNYTDPFKVRYTPGDPTQGRRSGGGGGRRSSRPSNGNMGANMSFCPPPHNFDNLKKHYM